MDFQLNADQQLYQRAVRNFVEAQVKLNESLNPL